MRSSWTITVSALMAALAASLTSCVDVNEPKVPDLVIQGDGEGSGTCTCDAQTMVNRTYRFSKLVVDQPGYESYRRVYAMGPARQDKDT